MLERFPGEDVADGVEAPSSETREVGMCFGQGKWAVDERDMVAIEELIADVGGQVGRSGEFGVGSDVDAVEDDLAVVSITEQRPVDSEAVIGHARCCCVGRARSGRGTGRDLCPGLRLRLLSSEAQID